MLLVVLGAYLLLAMLFCLALGWAARRQAQLAGADEENHPLEEGFVQPADKVLLSRQHSILRLRHRPPSAGSPSRAQCAHAGPSAAVEPSAVLQSPAP